MSKLMCNYIVYTVILCVFLFLVIFKSEVRRWFKLRQLMNMHPNKRGVCSNSPLSSMYGTWDVPFTWICQLHVKHSEINTMQNQMHVFYHISCIWVFLVDRWNIWINILTESHLQLFSAIIKSAWGRTTGSNANGNWENYNPTINLLHIGIIPWHHPKPTNTQIPWPLVHKQTVPNEPSPLVGKI
jgi:hypothetical protein